MTNQKVEKIVEEFEKEFRFDGVTYKGNRHWKENVKRDLVSNWLRQALAQREEEVRGEYKEALTMIEEVVKEAIMVSKNS